MSRFVLPLESTFNINGAPQDGAKLEFFNPGLLTNKDTYSDQALTTANTNPVIANASGRFGAIWMNGDYDVTLKDKNDVLIWGPERVLSNVTNGDAFKLNEVTTATMAADTAKTYVVGDVVETKEFSTGNGGGGTYDCVTVGTTANVDLPNTYNIIVSTVDATKCFVLRIEGSMLAEAFGASTSLTDNGPAINAALQAGVKSLSSNSELQVQESINIPASTTCDGLKVFSNGDTFTASTSPAAIVVNETFGTLASADEDVRFINGSIRVSGNTSAFSPKGIMFGGVKKGYILNNDITINGDKHSAAIECYKSTEDIWIERNALDIQTGNVTGGGIWLANRTSTETSKNIHVNSNVVKQDAIDEILAVFPSVGPMETVRINDNTLTRLDQGAATGPVMRVFCGDGLTGGTVNGTIKDVKGYGNTLENLRSTNTTSGTLQIGNGSADANDPEDIVFTNTTINGIFTSSAIAARFDFNSEPRNVGLNNAFITQTGALATSTVGVSSVTEGIFLDGGDIKGFGTNYDGYIVRNMKIVDGSIGMKVRGVAINNVCTGQASVPARVIAAGAGVTQLFQGNKLSAAASTRCLQLDAQSAVMDNLRLTNNEFDGAAGTVTAIEKLGASAITNTQTSGNDFSSCTTLWTNTLGMTLDRNTYSSSITTPAGNISADPGSVFWNSGGGASTTLYVKESNTGNTGWVAK